MQKNQLTTFQLVQPFPQPVLANARPLPPLETSSAKSKNKGVCALSDATKVYPSVTDKQKGYLHSGVDDKFISDRQSSTGGRAAGYGCEYSTVMKREGHIVKDCEFISTVHGQLSTHICQMHLRVAISCYVCQCKWWSAHTWIQHMRSSHTGLKEDDFYVQDGVDIADLRQALLIKKEINPEDIA